MNEMERYIRLVEILALVASLFGCEKHGQKDESDPILHFHVDSGWLGGIGGVAYDDGIYHLFVQYAPGDDSFHDTGWSHVTSSNLTEWTYDGLALSPDENGYIETGSVVVDSNNTSGLSEGNNYAYLAYYAYSKSEGSSKIGRAFSNDKGMTWKKLPLLSLTESKDLNHISPNIIWDSIHNQWVMTVTSNASVLFYTSRNCIDWNYASTFTDSADMKDVWWESANLILPKSHGSDPRKWVLLVNRNNGPANGSPATRYYVGDFDGDNFKETQYKKLWLDFGQDCSGVKTINKDNNVIIIGWMNNWDYANDLSSAIYKKALTIPRELELVQDGKHLVLTQFPIIYDASFVCSQYVVDGKKINDGDSVIVKIPKERNTYIIQADFDNNDHFAFWRAERFGLRLISNEGEVLSFLYDTRGEYYLLDRSSLCINELGAKENHVMGALYASLAKSSDWKIISDGNSIEFFADGGKVSITAICPKHGNYDRIVLFAQKGTITYNKLSIEMINK
jgi:sucrose-6-phosphate hydrolase SacC (GH32 family)